jgi:hypothetical protein
MTYLLPNLGIRLTVGLQGQKSWQCIKCGAARKFTEATAAALRKRTYSAGCCFRDGAFAAEFIKGEK